MNKKTGITHKTSVDKAVSDFTTFLVVGAINDNKFCVMCCENDICLMLHSALEFRENIRSFAVSEFVKRSFTCYLVCTGGIL